MTIRALAVVCFLSLAQAGVTAAAGPTGRLSGTTLISFGCPGPAREGEPGCNPWRPFAHARVSVGGRIVVSDARGRFALSLRPGTYVVAALPQAHARGASSVTVHVLAGGSVRVRVRFDGYPKMV
ncbi:MAG TPA: hypothetical protein VG073_10020 [Gaiellaceae bacterium]|nr:hypothetical protein [Gaiellaceae bacterium]